VDLLEDNQFLPESSYIPLLLTSLVPAFMTAKPIYFYKVNAPYGCFSNFSPHSVTIAGEKWQTVEHYYQAHKYVGTVNAAMIEKIRWAETPEMAASLGRDRALTLRQDWEEVKRDIMGRGVLTKFRTHADIRQVLLSTEDRLLVEDSPTDYYWGCGKEETGRNELGKILMQVRACLRESG
jgi:ribA/ribD-fused uncharacterized protein